MNIENNFIPIFTDFFFLQFTIQVNASKIILIAEKLYAVKLSLYFPNKILITCIGFSAMTI